MASAFNAHPGASFDGSDDRLVSASNFNSFIAADNGFCIAGFSIVSGVADNALVVSGSDSGLLRIDVNGATRKVEAFNDDGGADSVQSAAITLGAACVATWRHEGGTLYLSLNGAAEVSVASGNTQNLNGGPLAVFGPSGSGVYAPGTLMELALFSAAPGSTDRAARVTAFGAYLGLTI